MRTRFPARRTLPSRIVATWSAAPISRNSWSRFLKRSTDAREITFSDTDLGQLRDHVFGDPVGEEFVLRLAVHVAEREDGHRSRARLGAGGLRQRLGERADRGKAVRRRAR